MPVRISLRPPRIRVTPLRDYLLDSHTREYKATLQHSGTDEAAGLVERKPDARDAGRPCRFVASQQFCFCRRARDDVRSNCSGRTFQGMSRVAPRLVGACKLEPLEDQRCLLCKQLQNFPLQRVISEGETAQMSQIYWAACLSCRTHRKAKLASLLRCYLHLTYTMPRDLSHVVLSQLLIR